LNIDNKIFVNNGVTQVNPFYCSPPTFA